MNNPKFLSKTLRGIICGCLLVCMFQTRLYAQESKTAHVAKPVKKNTPNENTQTLLDQIEKDMYVVSPKLRARAQTDLARFYVPYNREKSKLLWQDAFNASLQLEEVNLALSLSNTSLQNPQGKNSNPAPDFNPGAAAYKLATLDSPASIQAAIIRDLVSAGELELATQYLYLLPKRKMDKPKPGATPLPLTNRRYQELPQALVLLPLSIAKRNPDQAELVFEEVVKKFESFPYSVAGPLIKQKDTNPEFGRQIARVVMTHFSSRELAPGDPGGSMDALNQLIALLPLLPPETATLGAEHIVEKLKKLQKDSPFFQKTGPRIESKVCVYIIKDQDAEKNGSPKQPCSQGTAPASTPAGDAAPPPSLPAELNTYLLRANKRGQIDKLSETDPDKAVDMAKSVDDPDERAELLANLSRKYIGKEQDKANQLLNEALGILKSRSSLESSQQLWSLVTIASLARGEDMDLFKQAVHLGVTHLKTDIFSNFNENEMEGILYKDAAIDLFGLWYLADFEEARTATLQIKDPEIRLNIILKSIKYSGASSSKSVRVPN